MKKILLTFILLTLIVPQITLADEVAAPAPVGTYNTGTVPGDTSGTQAVQAEVQGPPLPPSATGSNGCPQGIYCLLEPLPKIDSVAQDDKCVKGNLLICLDFNTFIEYVFKFAIALAVLLATVMIIIGGFQWMFSETPLK